MHLHRILAAALVVAAPVSVAASGWNVDFGSGAGVPSAVHAGPAGQPGHWNVVTGLEPEPIELLDVDGAPSAVTVTFSLPFGPAQSDHPGTSGDVEALLDDYLDLHSVPATMEIRGLPKGSYEITTVAWAPDLPGARTSVSLEGRRPVLVGGEWPGGYREGVTHAVHGTHAREGDVVVLRLFGIGKGTLNGVQIVRRGR
jgi:hypothetical protein